LPFSLRHRRRFFSSWLFRKTCLLLLSGPPPSPAFFVPTLSAMVCSSLFFSPSSSARANHLGFCLWSSLVLMAFITASWLDLFRRDSRALVSSLPLLGPLRVPNLFSVVFRFGPGRCALPFFCPLFLYPLNPPACFSLSFPCVFFPAPRPQSQPPSVVDSPKWFVQFPTAPPRLRFFPMISISIYQLAALFPGPLRFRFC